MIEIKYCGVCGDQVVVEKLEERLSELGEVQKTECGNCKMKVKAGEEEIFNEEKNILDLNKITESVKTAVN